NEHYNPSPCFCCRHWATKRFTVHIFGGTLVQIGYSKIVLPSIAMFVALVLSASLVRASDVAPRGDVSPLFGALPPTFATGGTPFSGTMPVTGGNQGLTGLVVTGLPAGLTASINGTNIVITGTTTVVTTATVSVTVKNVNNLSATKQYTLSVFAGQPAT